MQSRCSSNIYIFADVHSLQLVTHIESEHLLDPEHFFDWIVTALKCSDQDELPAWILVIEAHLDETKRFRFRCRRLIEALLDQLKRVRVQCAAPPGSVPLC